MTDNYEKILNRIEKASGVSKDELERKVEAKRARLSGLISKEGAAQVIAAELGVSFDNEKLKIEELLPGMKKINITGKIIRLFPVRTFTNSKGQEGKVVNFRLADDTSNIKVVLWDTNHIELIESGKLQEGSVVEISNGSIRDEEIHLGSFSELKPSDEAFENVVEERIVKEKPIKDFKTGDSAMTRAFIVQSFEPRFFYVCPQCSKKVVQDESGKYTCQEHGVVDAVKKALMNFVIDDGTETIRSVAFSDQLQLLGLTEFDDKERMSFQREDLMGKEMIFSGNVRMNNYFNKPEYIIDSATNVDLDKLISELEK